LAACPDVEAQQQSSKISKIGWLVAGSAPGPVNGPSGIERELLELGYVNGRNVSIEYRYAGNKLDRLPALANELVRINVDVLVASTTNGALAAKNATSTIPIIFVDVSDPVASGLIGSLARPGGNITGVTNVAAVLTGKRLELIKETIPTLSRLAILWNPLDPASAQKWQ
jgi:putative ABC transport system substrate-binding protein